MDHEWIVEATDQAGTPVTGARVALVPASEMAGLEWPFATIAATHGHIGGGIYKASKPIVPVAGDWFLIATIKGKSPVVQPLTMTAKSKAEMRTAPSPKTAATVAFTSEIKQIGGSQVRRARFKLTLFPSAEVVFISGTEYFDGGTRFRIFAENHAIALRREKKVDAGTIITLFAADDRSRDTIVYATGGALMRIASKSFGSTNDIVPGKQRAPVVGSDISVVDLYKYLSGVGVSEPGRVKEVGFFSHSFPGGPILFNSADEPSVPQRSAADFDARMKDFNPTNRANWPNLKAAMAGDASWHIWGCSATTHYKNLIAAATLHRNDDENEFFTVKTLLRDHNGRVSTLTEERTTRKRLREDMYYQFRSSSYMAAAAAHLGIAVFGAPPGVGSSFANPQLAGSPDLSIMFIDTKSNKTQYGYFRTEFAPSFVPTDAPFDKGYVDYRDLGKLPAPPKAPFSSEFYVLDTRLPKRDKSDPGAIRIRFANGSHDQIDGSKFRLDITTKANFATAGLTGHLYVLYCNENPTRSRGFYVQEDARTFRVFPDSEGRFSVRGARLL